MASEWWQSRAQGTIHTRNCVLLAPSRQEDDLPQHQQQQKAPWRAGGRDDKAAGDDDAEKEREKARAVKEALRDTAHYAGWWPSDLSVAPLAQEDEGQLPPAQSTRIRVCSPLGACWEGVLEREEEVQGAGVRQEWAYDRGAFRGRGVWSVSPAPSLSRCMHAPTTTDAQNGDGDDGDGGDGDGDGDGHQHWCVCYEADLEAKGRARLGMRLGLDLAHMQARGTDDLLTSLSALADRTVSAPK